MHYESNPTVSSHEPRPSDQTAVIAENCLWGLYHRPECVNRQAGVTTPGAMENAMAPIGFIQLAAILVLNASWLEKVKAGSEDGCQ